MLVRQIEASGQLTRAKLGPHTVANLIVTDVLAALGRYLHNAGRCTRAIERRSSCTLYYLDRLDSHGVNVGDRGAQDHAVDNEERLLVTAGRIDAGCTAHQDGRCRARTAGHTNH